MVKCPDALAKIIENNATWFEKIVLATARKDIKYFNKIKGIVCLEAGPKKKHADDFDIYAHNVIYAAIRDYNSLFAEAAKSFSPMSVEFLRQWLNDSAKRAEFVSLSEVESVATYFENEIIVIELKEDVTHFAKLGIASYLKKRRANQILNRASLCSYSLDDLALICEQDIDVINNIEEEGRIISDVPDRVQLQDMDLFDDPNKKLVESLDSDMPDLNEALGGGFRKRSAYMIIGTTGSGKTIIACQLACAFSYNCGGNGLFISTEQQHDELYRRMVSNLCRIPHKVISKGIFEHVLSAKEKEMYIDFRKTLNTINKGDMRVINWGNFEKQPGTKVIKAIEDEIDLYEEETGRKLDYIILDWIGGALGSMAEAGDKTRHIYQEAADAMDELARKRNIVTVALAQAHVSAVNKVQISAADLSECKSMTRNYAGVIGITALFSEEYARQMHEEKNKRRKDFKVANDIDDAVSYNSKQYLHISKSRYGVQKSVAFIRDYEYQRMKPFASAKHPYNGI